MKVTIITFVLVIISLQGCSPTKGGLTKDQKETDPILVSIIDFSQRKNLTTTDSVFLVIMMGLKNNDGLLVVRIGKNTNKLLFRSALCFCCVIDTG